MCVLVVSQVITGIFAFATSGKLVASARNEFEFVWNQKPATNSSIDKVQTYLQCCGLNGPLDLPSKYFSALCCQADITNCQPANAFQKGCMEMVGVFAKKSRNSIGVVSFALLPQMVRISRFIQMVRDNTINYCFSDNLLPVFICFIHSLNFHQFHVSQMWTIM